LCRDAILKYLDADAPDAYNRRLRQLQDEVRIEVLRIMAEDGE
jgi:hypothetical protein